MGNFDTVTAITDNIQRALEAEGINFSRAVYEDERTVPASLIPLGRIFYAGETFEYSHGQRPKYAEAEFAVRVILNERDPVDRVRSQQKWAHGIREALTVAALNTGDLSSTRLVSRVTTARVDAQTRGSTSAVVCRTLVRYREV